MLQMKRLCLLNKPRIKKLTMRPEKLKVNLSIPLKRLMMLKTKNLLPSNQLIKPSTLMLTRLLSHLRKMTRKMTLPNKLRSKDKSLPSAPLTKTMTESSKLLPKTTSIELMPSLHSRRKMVIPRLQLKRSQLPMRSKSKS